MPAITRRTIIGSLGIMAVDGLWCMPTAQAQSLDADLQRLRNAIPVVFNPDVRLAPNEDFVSDFAAQEFPARQRFFADLQDRPIVEITESLDPEFLEQVPLTDEDVALLIIPPDQITPIKALVIEEPKTDDTQFEVVVDILLGTLGLHPLKSAFVELNAENAFFSERIASLANAIGVRDQVRAMNIVFELAAWLLSGPGITALRAIVRDMPASQIRRVLLIGIGSRLAPFVGWVFTGASFTTCLYVNQRRLAAVFR